MLSEINNFSTISPAGKYEYACWADHSRSPLFTSNWRSVGIVLRKRFNSKRRRLASGCLRKSMMIYTVWSKKVSFPVAPVYILSFSVFITHQSIGTSCVNVVYLAEQLLVELSPLSDVVRARAINRRLFVIARCSSAWHKSNKQNQLLLEQLSLSSSSFRRCRSTDIYPSNLSIFKLDQIACVGTRVEPWILLLSLVGIQD